MASSNSVRATTLAYIGVAAAAMVATLPGRTHGLGLVTEPLLVDLSLNRVAFAALNFWATVLGAAFCLPVGWLIDRVGLRAMLAGVSLALGSVVVAMGETTTGSRTMVILAPELVSGAVLEWCAVPVDLLLLVLLTRGLGQSALSVVSLTLLGKVAGRKPGLLVGVYSFLVAIGFMGAFMGVKAAFTQWSLGWRELWSALGYILLGAGVIAAFLVRDPRPSREDCPSDEPARSSVTFGQALLTPAFWVFGLATSFFGLVAAGLSLFNQSVLAERNFDRSVFLTITTLSPLVGLAANLLAGWLATRIRLGVILAGGLLIQAAALALFPWVETIEQVYAYAVAMGVAGGVMTVVFFTFWPHAYGPAHLGRIQGAAQLLTVFASALGPLLLALGHRLSGSYAQHLQVLAAVSAAFAVAAFVVPVPKPPPETPS